MKVLFIIFCILVIPAHARQYIQCGDADTTNAAVVNLNGDKSTLFMTDGVHLPDETRIVKKLYFVSTTNLVTKYETRSGDSKQTVIIPTEVIGKRSNNFNITFDIESTEASFPYEMSCFSSIYED